MLTVLVQFLVAMAACGALWLLWTRFAREQIGTTIVAIGFLGRAVLGIVLFWVSWLRLPLGSSLQIEDGLWFFGFDGLGYYNQADRWIASGVSSLLIPDQMNASYIWVQLLASTRILMGGSTAVALLLNMAAFLGIVCLVASWGRRTARVRGATITLGLMSFCPSLTLWATQPLKDTLFILLVVTFVFGLGLLLATSEAGRFAAASGTAVVLVMTLHVIGGVRWYYAVILWMLFLPVATWGGMIQRTERVKTLLLSLGTFVVAGLALAANRPFPFGQAVVGMFRIPAWFFTLLSDSRAGFEKGYDPASLISPGPVIESLPYADVIARAVMTFVPRFVASPLGLATAGGGRGLWFFAELDTLFFTGCAITIGILLWRRGPVGFLRNPMLAFLILLLCSSLPMLYAVNNFGTLLRFREMLLLPILLMPLAMPDRESGDQQATNAS